MAAATIGGGIFNAVAFALAGWAFSKIDKKGYASEMKRHNLAMEKLTQEENSWRHRRDEELSRLSKLRQDRVEALKSEQITDDNLLYYHKKMEEEEKKMKHHWEKNRPQLQYTPSPIFQKYIRWSEFLLGGSSLATLGYFLL